MSNGNDSGKSDRKDKTYYHHNFEEHSKTIQVHTFYLFDAIADPTNYVQLVDKLFSLTEDDQAIFKISSPGGSLSTAMILRAAIRSCEAHTTTILSGENASAAGMIFTAGVARFCDPGSSLMIHNYSYGAAGKEHEIISQVEFFRDMYNNEYKEIYRDLLTKKELKRVIKGQDIYLTGNDVNARIEKSDAKYLAKAISESEKSKS